MQNIHTVTISSVQWLSHVWLFATPWTLCLFLGFPVHHQLPEVAQTHVRWVGDAIQSSQPLLSPSPPAFNLPQHQALFKCVSTLHRWSKYWNFSFSISPSSEYSGLISFRMDWSDLLAVQGTLQGSSPTPHFKSINSSAFRFLYSPTLTSIQWLLEKL